MNQKIIEKAKKLLALSEQGIDGEKITAEKFLINFLAKHGLTMADICDEVISMHPITIKATKEHDSLFDQIVYSLERDSLIDIYTFRGSKSKRVVKCSTSEFIEIELKYTIYAKAFDKELEKIKGDALAAFIHKNAIFKTDSDDEKAGEEEPLTKEARDRIERIVALMGTMGHTSVHLGIERK